MQRRIISETMLAPGANHESRPPDVLPQFPVHCRSNPTRLKGMALVAILLSLPWLLVQSSPLQIQTQGVGSITASPNQTNYAPGQTVTLTATAGRWYQFVRWSDGD